MKPMRRTTSIFPMIGLVCWLALTCSLPDGMQWEGYHPFKSFSKSKREQISRRASTFFRSRQKPNLSNVKRFLTLLCESNEIVWFFLGLLPIIAKALWWRSFISPYSLHLLYITMSDRKQAVDNKQQDFRNIVVERPHRSGFSFFCHGCYLLTSNLPQWPPCKKSKTGSQMDKVRKYWKHPVQRRADIGGQVPWVDEGNKWDLPRSEFNFNLVVVQFRTKKKWHTHVCMASPKTNSLLCKTERANGRESWLPRLSRAWRRADIS